ncbi:MAG: glycosyltransferase family 2 protein [Candidatus Magasanikbacteria bacterium]|nr:glycosyltransferase family 2 protein [Candidatus Magasanikbacteria bacterium]
MQTTIVIPAYNEGGRVGETIRAIFALERGYKVVVVDDGSVDGTSDAARFAGATVLRHAVNRGQGAALQTGTEWALARGADHIVHFDADGQFDAADILRGIALLVESSLDVVLGSRIVIPPDQSPGQAIRDPVNLLDPRFRGDDNQNRNTIPFTKRYVLFPIARLVNWAFTGVWLTDAHNGFRVLSRRAAEQIVIHHDRMAHNTDIVAQIREREISFAEMPIHVRYNRYGQGLGGGVKIVADLLIGWFT